LSQQLLVAKPRTESIRRLLRTERLPHIWCPGCGIGIVLKCYLEAVARSGIPEDKHVIVSGIGCAGRAAGYARLDGYHVLHGRAIPFAVGLKSANPELEVTVFSGDGDLLSIGGNHFIHAIRRNDDINVILINNFIYGMTGGQYSSTTLPGAVTNTSPYGFLEGAFNVPYLAAALGANFVARWTPLHQKELTNAILEMFKVDGFAIVEVVSPCLIFAELNGLTPLEMMKEFRKRCVIDHNADLSKIELSMDPKKPIVLGNFVRRKRPSYQTLYYEKLLKRKRPGLRW
jgi:2-oxoglutarate ferredoxin oxidoreductase subunit beta